MFDKQYAKDMIIFFVMAFFIIFGLINIGIFLEKSQIISPQAHDMGDAVTCYTFNTSIDCLQVLADD